MTDEIEKSNETSEIILQAKIKSIKGNTNKLYMHCLYCKEKLVDESGNPKPRKFCNTVCADDYERQNK